MFAGTVVINQEAGRRRKAGLDCEHAFESIIVNKYYMLCFVLTRITAVRKASSADRGAFFNFMIYMIKFSK